MSRVGKQPVKIPTGVEVKVTGQAGSLNKVTVKGPKGQLELDCPVGISIQLNSGEAVVTCENIGDTRLRTLYGTTRAHLNNMVNGVSQGWYKGLELVGVGFTAKLEQNTLILTVGFSHEVRVPVPSGITCKVEKTSIKMEFIDKQLGGDFAARIRKIQPPEPYLGKGIKYEGEVVRRKAGKTGKK